MNYLDRRHYQLLIAVSRHRQLTRAADELGLTQPAASHQIREAERRLGVTLFRRSGRSMELTPAAERLLMAGLYAEDTFRKAELDAVEMERNALPILRVALGNFDNVNWLPSALKALETVNPVARIELLRCSNVELRDALATGRADCFVSPRDEHFSDLRSTPLFDDELLAIFPPKVPSLTKTIAASDFEGWRYIAFQAHPTPGFEYERFFQQGGFIPREVFQVETSCGVLSLVAEGQGASIMPAWCMAAERRAGLVSAHTLAPRSLQVTWELYYGNGLAAMKGAMLAALVAAIMSNGPQTAQRL